MKTAEAMNTAIWIGLIVMALVGLVGVTRPGDYVPESAALLLVALAIGLRRLTWGRGFSDDADDERPEREDET